jgi:NADPH:quinone reductase-like Zn-dependent oxidoreductase
VTAFALSTKSAQEYVALGVNECSKVGGKSYQHAISPIAHHAQVPPNMTLESAATIPDNFVTAFYVLFDRLKLPVPLELPATTPPKDADTPILIYGSGSTAGQYSIQLLKLAGYTRIITTASPKHRDALLSFGAAHVIDYNSPALTDDIIRAAGGKVPLALDCISAEGTLAAISKVLSPDGTIALLLPIKEGNAVTGAPDSQLLTSIPEAKNPFEKSVNIVYVSSFTYQAVSSSASPSAR